MGSSHRLAELGVKTAAYLLAVSFEDGIVNFGRGGTVQGVSDAPYRLLPAAFVWRRVTSMVNNGPV